MQPGVVQPPQTRRLNDEKTRRREHKGQEATEGRSACMVHDSCTRRWVTETEASPRRGKLPNASPPLCGCAWKSLVCRCSLSSRLIPLPPV